MHILYPLFIILSFVLPRDKKIWVFGCRKGYLDNTKYFFEYAASQKEFNCYWLANNNNELLEVKRAGYTAILKKSLLGYWISSRANVSFICTGFTDVNRILCLRSIVINFWHGTPIKKLYFSAERYSKKNNHKYLVNFLRKKVISFLIYNTNFYYASNSFEREIVTSSAKMPFGKSLALGAPRFDAIRNSNPIEILEGFKEKHKKILLYAPTWRNGEFSNEFEISKSEFLKLNKVLENSEAILIVKPHFNTPSQYFRDLGLKASGRVFYAEDIGLEDINDIYRYTDVLITDVSSALFDYLIFDKPIIIFMPDYKDYLLGDFGIYDYFVDILKHNSIINWNGVIKELEKISAGNIKNIEVFSNIAKEVKGLESVNQSIYNDVKFRFYKL